MKTIRLKFAATLAVTAALSLAACSGSHGTGSAPIPGAVPTASPASGGPGTLANVTLAITIPAPSSATRRPAYVSQATKSIKVVLSSPPTGYNQPAAFNVTTGTGNCPGTGPWTCTVTFGIPPGSDTITVTLYDNTGGTGNILSQQIQTLSVVAGIANSFSMTFDANAAAISLSGTQACTSGSIQTVFGSVGTSPVTINVSFTDAASKTIVAPGRPIIAIQDNTSTFQTSSGTINGTGGTVSFTINQATQSFTLTPSTAPMSGASVVVRGTPANTNSSSDGLAFNQSHTFTFSTGTAQPGSFLAVVEQTGSTGQVNFYTVNLVSGGPDALNAYSTPTLATTTSINAAPDGQQPDVDNPQDVAFDSGGNLLISNGGTTVGGDFGNFACVPAGAISTGANLATTNRTNVKDPIGIAVASNGTVGLANNPAGAAVKVQEFALSTNYVAGSNLPDPGGNTYGVPINRPFVNMPTLTTGTFAVGLFNGTHSQLDIIGPTGTVATLSDTNDTHLQDPNGMDWDPNSNQLVVADNNGAASYLNFYTVSNPPASPVNVKSFFLQNDPSPSTDCAGGNPCSGMIGQKVAVSPAGVVAVAGLNVYNSLSGGPEIQLYDATSNRNAVPNGVIPFDTSDTGSDSCNGLGFTYGGSGGSINAIIQQMRWLSSTKLMVLLSAPSATSKQGIYIFDTSVTAQPPGFWCPPPAFTGAAPPVGPKQTGFLNTPSLIPHAAAFKP